MGDTEGKHFAEDTASAEAQSTTETEGTATVPQGTTEPTNLAEALAAVRQIDKAGTEKPVAADTSGARQPEASTASTGSTDTPATEAPATIGGLESAGGTSGGSSEQQSATAQGNQPAAPQVNYQDQVKEVARQTARQAETLVRQKFNEQNIKTFSLSDITKRDPQKGTITFENPDDRSRPFSSRAEASAWVDSMNKEIESVYKREVQQEHSRLMTEAAPTLRLIEYAPKFDKLSEPEQDMVLEIIAPYAVTDKSGQVIGYNCDLDVATTTVKNQVKALAKAALKNKSTATTAEAPATTPSLDTNTTGSSSAATAADSAPKTLEDAMRQLRNSEKGKK